MNSAKVTETAPEPSEVIETALSGNQLLTDPYLNKGSAFPEDERIAFGLSGLLPPHVSTVEQQLQRTYANFKAKDSPIEKNIFLASLQDRNETLFYRLIRDHIAEMVPIIYTPTVGEACQRYSHVFRRARGLYLSYPDRGRMDAMLQNVLQDDLAVIVVTDGERILGLGDLGVGGMGIPVGKLALYSLCAGIHPRKTLPILLDVGTNNQELLKDPLYLGWHHPRLERKEYDAFIDLFVKAVLKRWPRVLLQWEDFSKSNAARLLARYKDEICSFNDDIQGTAAVTLAGLLRAVKVTGRALNEERVVIAGAGSAATGIAELLIMALREKGVADAAARSAIWLIDTQGLVHAGRTDLSGEKKPFAQTLEGLKSAGLNPSGPVDLMEIVKKVKPTALIGTSGQPGVFTRELVQSMAASVKRPIIFPLSNPTSKSEAVPADLFAWTEGRALVATGSPFPPAASPDGPVPIGQCNNAYVFPGVGLGLTAVRANRVPNELFLTAAKTLADFDDRLPGFEKSLFPNLENVRAVSEKIALAVARQAVSLGLSAPGIREADVPNLVKKTVWNPVYPKLKKISR